MSNAMTFPAPAGTCVLLLRHAETSAPEFFHGAESDVGLSLTGQAQAREAALRIRERVPDSVHSSALRRARETAEPIAGACGLELIVHPGLHERQMGPLSGAPREGAWSVYEAARQAWMAGDLDATHPGGESFAAMRERLLPVFHAIVVAEPGRTIVVVAHGVVIRVLLTSIVEGLTPTDFTAIPIDHVRIHELCADGERWRLLPDPDAAPTSLPW